MSWKNWPSWLKGGVIAIEIDLIILVILFIGLFISSGEEFMYDVFFPLLGITQLFISSFLYFTGGIGEALDIFIKISILSGLVTWFLIGALIGLVVGKIKENKK